VLEAARAAFAAEGIGVPLDEIARRAGVGAGTVHRHFPTKEALFTAVVTDHLAEQVAAARAAVEADDAGQAFFAFVAQMTAAAQDKKDLADALAGAGVDLTIALDAAAELTGLLADLLARAQDAGAVRDDIDTADLHAIVLAAMNAERSRADSERPGRLAQLVCDCLRPNPGPGA
jgi:AcrR family transcriptional regulator